MQTKANKKQIQAVLHYWFGELIDGWTSSDRNALWFESRATDDTDMQVQFLAMIELALAGKLEKWREDPEGLMAYIILLDQMTRAVYRGTAKAFAGDNKALAACKAAIATGMDLQLPAIHCRFFYLPFEHSEDIADQKQCITLFTALQQRFPERKEEFIDSLFYVQQHLDIIQRFGRFPHRNAILGRTNSREEEQYLSAKDTPLFGQG